MNNPPLQEPSMDGISFFMPQKKKDERKRDRLLLEMPPGGRDVWLEARSVALRKRLTIGEFAIAAIREKLEREGALGDRKKR